MRPIRRVVSCVLIPLGLMCAQRSRAEWPLSPDVVYKPGIADGDERNPQLWADGARGWCLAWNQEFYTFGIRVQRLDRSGNPLWGPSGQMLTSWTYPAPGFRVVAMRPFDDGHVLVATEDPQLQLGLWCVDSLGHSCWGDQPVSVSDSASTVVYLWPVSRSTGWLVWWVNKDPNANSGGFWRARSVGTGDPSNWGPERTLTSLRPDANPVQGSANEESGEALFLAWTETAGTGIGPRVLKLTANGDTPWGDSGVAVSSLSGGVVVPSVAADGLGGAFVCVTTDYANVRVQRLRPDGERTFGPDGSVVPSRGFQSLDWPSIACVAPGSAVVVAIDRAINGACFAHVDTSGLWSPTNGGTPLTDPPVYANGLAASATGDGGFIATWSGAWGNGGMVLKAQRVGPDGRRCWSDTGSTRMRFPEPDPLAPIPIDVSLRAVGPAGDVVSLALVREPAQSPPRPSKAWLNRIDENGLFGNPVADVSEQRNLSFAMSPPAPLPCRDRIRLQWSCPDQGPVRIALYDVSGRAVATLYDGIAPRGVHTLDVRLDTGAGGPPPPGLYFVRVAWRDRQLAHRLVVTR